MLKDPADEKADEDAVREVCSIGCSWCVCLESSMMQPPLRCGARLAAATAPGARD